MKPLMELSATLDTVVPNSSELFKVCRISTSTDIDHTNFIPFQKFIYFFLFKIILFEKLISMNIKRKLYFYFTLACDEQFLSFEVFTKNS